MASRAEPVMASTISSRRSSKRCFCFCVKARNFGSVMGSTMMVSAENVCFAGGGVNFLGAAGVLVLAFGATTGSTALLTTALGSEVLGFAVLTNVLGSAFAGSLAAAAGFFGSACGLAFVGADAFFAAGAVAFLTTGVAALFTGACATAAFFAAFLAAVFFAGTAAA